MKNIQYNNSVYEAKGVFIIFVVIYHFLLETLNVNLVSIIFIPSTYRAITFHIIEIYLCLKNLFEHSPVLYYTEIVLRSGMFCITSYNYHS